MLGQFASNEREERLRVRDKRCRRWDGNHGVRKVMERAGARCWFKERGNKEGRERVKF